MKQVADQVRQFIAAVKKSGIPVKSASLFGSYAKGTAREWSDIDICVVSDTFGKDYFDERLTLYRIASKIDDRIEPVPLNTKDLNDPLDTLASEIRKYSIPITV